jgi:hypothetical protein
MRASLVLAIIAVLSCGGTSSSPAGDSGAGAGGSQTTVGPHGCSNVQGSCTSNMGVSCEELSGFDAASVARFKAGCNHPNQVYSDGACDRTGAVGGCGTVVRGTCGVIWSFPPVTAAQLQSSCVGQYLMFFPP